jgi:endonuclease YncB( thermonuclease family)
MPWSVVPDPRHHRPILLFVLLLLSIGASADTLTGKVVRVLDGDTVEVITPDKTLHRVRLAGIDAPGGGQPFGTKAKQHLLALVGGDPVVVDWHKRTVTVGWSGRS